MASNIKLLRQLISEVRMSTAEGSVRDSLITRYILNQFRKYQSTDQQLCKAQEEMTFMANTYLCYLQSGRKYQKINAEYTGKGERTFKETADMVGFKLPHEYKEPK